MARDKADAEGRLFPCGQVARKGGVVFCLSPASRSVKVSCLGYLQSGWIGTRSREAESSSCLASHVSGIAIDHFVILV